MSLSFSRYVRFIFHACRVLSLRVISLHLPSCRLVSLSFVSLSFPLHSPCFHFCPFHVPFSSPLFPFHFPLLSCHVDFLFPPLISLHFLAFPLCSPVFRKNTVFPAFSQRGRQKPEFLQIFGKRWQVNSSLEPLFCDTGSPKTTFSGTSSNCRAVRGGTLLGIRHAFAMSADRLRTKGYPYSNPLDKLFTCV